MSKFFYFVQTEIKNFGSICKVYGYPRIDVTYREKLKETYLEDYVNMCDNLLDCTPHCDSTLYSPR